MKKSFIVTMAASAPVTDTVSTDTARTDAVTATTTITATTP